MLQNLIGKSAQKDWFQIKKFLLRPSYRQWCPRYELQVPMKGEGMGGIHWVQLVVSVRCIGGYFLYF